MIRTFVAIELDEGLRRSLTQLQERLRRELVGGEARKKDRVRVQWTRPESLHVTLKFLGNIEEAQADRIRQALTRVAAGHRPFTVSVEGLGTFPDARAPRIIWVGLKEPDGDYPLIALASSVEQALQPLGFEPEGRPFSPHLTLARLKDGGRELAHSLRTSGRFASTAPAEPLGTLAVEQIVLMKSDLQPTGSIYTRLFAVPLGA